LFEISTVANTVMDLTFPFY